MTPAADRSPIQIAVSRIGHQSILDRGAPWLIPACSVQLRAIFSADVKGYSKLMGEDDEHTINTITEYRRIITGLIEAHHGRVVDAPGDNIPTEFNSALNAVNSAVEIQRTLETENGKLPDKRRMEFRIGINLGNILHKDDRIYGDGVNVAARIGSL